MLPSMSAQRHAFTVPTLAAALAGMLPAQHDGGAVSGRPGVFVAPASPEAQDQIKSFQVAPGLVCDLVAAEPDLCNAVAFAIDGKGRFYVAETFRINDGVFDTQGNLYFTDQGQTGMHDPSGRL